MSSKLPFSIPSASVIADPATRAILTAMERNLRTLYGETGGRNDAAVLVGDAVKAGIATLDRGVLAAAGAAGKVTAGSSGGSLTVSSSGWYAGVLRVPAGGLGVGLYTVGIRLPRLALVRNSFLVITDALASDSNLATMAAGVDVDAPASILAATVISGMPTGIMAGAQDGSVAKFSPVVQVPRDLTVSVGVEGLTAGRLVVMAEIILTA